MQNLKLKYFIYVRKSTESDESQVRSIGDQLSEIRELVARERLAVVDMLAEQQSAKVKGRPIFNEMLARIEAGEANGIIAWHPDRLARNAFDGGYIIDLIDEGKIRALKFFSFWFEPTAQGKLMLGNAFSQSKYFSDNLSDLVRRSQRQKTKEGIWAWKAPVGYLNEPRLRTIVVDPVKAPLVQKMFELYATGRYSMLQLRDTMNEMGLRGWTNVPWSVSRYQDSLNNPFYYGLMRLQGELHQGTHEPLITKQLFDTCQAVMRKRSRPDTPRLKTYVYRGLLQCGECGCGITMETQKGHNYLRCTKRVAKDCSQRYLREEQLSEQIAGVLSSASLPDDTADWMLRKIKAEREQETGASQEVRETTQMEIEQLDSQIDRLTSAYLENEVFTPQEFKSRKSKFVDSKQELVEKLDILDTDDVARFEPLVRFINRSKQAKYVAAGLQPAQLRTELEKIGSNLHLLNRELRYEARGAWKLVVGQGSFAHHNTAPTKVGAVFAGESHPVPIEYRPRESNRLRHRRNCPPGGRSRPRRLVR